MQWAKFYMFKAGLFDQPQRGRLVASDAGRACKGRCRGGAELLVALASLACCNPLAGNADGHFRGGDMSTQDESQTIGVEAVLELAGTNREAKAYAFLYAAFKRTEISSNPVRDALDCLIPFSAPYLNTIVGKQVTVDGVQQYLKSTFGFDIPLYAVEQMFPSLQKSGYIEYNKNIRRHYAKQQTIRHDVIKSEIETDFDYLAEKLSEFANDKGFTQSPPSGTWGEALITFLKSSTDRANVKPAIVKGALLDPGKLESAIVGAFIKYLHSYQSTHFTKLLNVFMGVLVEEFIASVSEIGAVDLKRPVHVCYDTGVLLRLLGCSGKLLKTATDELTRYLQDLGYQTYYFSGNETEVAGILDTLIHVKDTGGELEGETAEAISLGEVNMTQIRMLQNTFPERLAALGVFPADRLEPSVSDNAKHQIDERGFTVYLKEQALAKRRSYSIQNRENDAGYLAAIMRLRKRVTTRDLASCGYIFVTSNKLLAQVSRRYLIMQKVIKPQHCPPILSVGQIATIAWLMKDQALVPEKAGRELLSNCFAAVRPDQEWFRHFRAGVEEVKGNIEEYGKDPSNVLTLQAARRIAQEQSFGESAIVRELNMVEILSRAEQENERALREKESQAAADREAAVQSAVAEARREADSLNAANRREVAYRKADSIVRFLKLLAVAAFIVASGYAIYLSNIGSATVESLILSGLFLFINALSFMDLLGVKLVRRIFARLRELAAVMFLV